MKFNKDEVCILIPTLNEDVTIGQIVREFKGLGYNHILVMDGKSTDNTVKIAREAVPLSGHSRVREKATQSSRHSKS